MNHPENNPLFKRWSITVAYAESFPVDSQKAIKAWKRADILWHEFQQSKYDDAPLDESDLFGAMRP